MLALLPFAIAVESRFFSPPPLTPTWQEAVGRSSLSTLPARPAYLRTRDGTWDPVVYSRRQSERAFPASAFVGALCGIVGAAVYSEQKRSTSHGRSGLAAVEMMGRKGRPKMPTPMAGQAYGGQMQQQAPAAPVDGMPVFYIYCRTGPGKPWYPVSAFKGDGKAKSLINAWLDSPLAKGLFKEKVEENVARSIYESERRLANLAVEQYQQLSQQKTRLQWGYKILDENLTQKEKEGKVEKQKIVPVTKGMVKEGLLDQAKSMFGGMGNGS